ncbi:hypothetical protein [Alteribacter aurantiacus]|uniref:hypothetical protein n=1 Tax=Alteribacter aurantiacus TaxID=254410 RepID=UPI0004276D39|nr:hypothetical protein [Alteribacter aurantiacus]
MNNQTRMLISTLGCLLILGVGIYRLLFEDMEGSYVMMPILFTVVGAFGLAVNAREWKKGKNEAKKG